MCCIYVRINGLAVGSWGPEAVSSSAGQFVHAVGAWKAWAGQGTRFGERGRQRGCQHQRETGRAVGVGVLATRFPTCVETGV